MLTSGMKKVIALACLGAAAFVARCYLQKTMADVPTELRRPFLPLTSGSFTPRTLPLWRAAFRLRMRPGPGVTVTEHHVAGDSAVRVLCHGTFPVPPNRPAVLWIHSGGMVVGSPQFEAPTAGRLARELGAVLVSPDYRLAPENPFPAALDDCMTTLRWMHERADELGVDPTRIAVGGMSAGGGLAAAVAQRSYDEGLTLRAQVLVYPMLDDRTALREDHAGRGQFVFTPEANRFGWTAYLGREPRMSDAPEYAAPARREDISNLPTTWIGVGDLDILYDESVEYADRLKACGVPCELVTVEGMYHGADGLAPKASSMQAFRQSFVNHLRAHL